MSDNFSIMPFPPSFLKEVLQFPGVCRLDLLPVLLEVLCQHVSMYAESDTLPPVSITEILAMRSWYSRRT